MKHSLSYRLISACAVAGMALGSGAVYAVGQGDWLVRLGASHVRPDDTSFGLSGGDGRVSVDKDTQPSFTISYFLTDNFAVELLGSFPFKHDIKGEGALSGAGTVATVKHLPPTLSAQYHFQPGSQLKPYVGFGINYTNFYDEEAKGVLADETIRLDNSWGLAAQAGVDIEFQRDWYVNFDLRYIDMSTTAVITGPAGAADINLDPFIYSLAVGKRF